MFQPHYRQDESFLATPAFFGEYLRDSQTTASVPRRSGDAELMVRVRRILRPAERFHGQRVDSCSTHRVINCGFGTNDE